MRLYFAHPVNVYDTPLEIAITALIQHCFPDDEVVTPNTQAQQRAYDAVKDATGGTHADHRGMDTFYRTVDSCDGCVSMPFLDNRMGLGVAGETQKTLKAGKQAWLIEPSYALAKAELNAFVENPQNGAFKIRKFTPEEVGILRNRQELKADPPDFVVGHEETRLRTFIQYNGAKRPYAEAHLVKLPVPDDFYALDPKKK